MSIWTKYKDETSHVKNHFMQTAPKESGSLFPWTDGRYKWEHTLMVLNSALLLAREERADQDVVALAAIFHDVSYYDVDYEEHGHEGAKYAFEYLGKRITQTTS